MRKLRCHQLAVVETLHPLKPGLPGDTKTQLVNLIGFMTRATSFILRYTQTGVVSTYATAIVLGVVLVLALMLFGQ